MNKEQRIKIIKSTATTRILNAMESSDKNWIQEWTGGNAELPVNPTTKISYSGINVMWLMMQGCPSNKWAGYKQWKKAGRQVKFEETGTDIIRVVPIQEKDENGKKTGETIPVIKVLKVFNESQLTDYEHQEVQATDPGWVHQEIDDMIKQLGINIQYGTEASYNHITDIITLPEQKAFKSTEGTAKQNYYGTKLHEISHWTGHESRLNRNLSKKDKIRYAKEELIAEFTATLLSAYYGIEHTPLKSHAQYLNGWIDILKVDNEVIWETAKTAHEAMDYIVTNGKSLAKVA